MTLHIISSTSRKLKEFPKTGVRNLRAAPLFSGFLMIVSRSTDNRSEEGEEMALEAVDEHDLTRYLMAGLRRPRRKIKSLMPVSRGRWKAPNIILWRRRFRSSQRQKDSQRRFGANGERDVSPRKAADGVVSVTSIGHEAKSVVLSG